LRHSPFSILADQRCCFANAAYGDGLEIEKEKGRENAEMPWEWTRTKRKRERERERERELGTMLGVFICESLEHGLL